MQLHEGAESRTLARREVAGLTLSECFYPARLRMPRHEHEPASFSLLLAGGYSESFRRETFDCAPACVVFRPPAESHAVAFAADARIFRLDIEPRWLERLRDAGARLDAATRFASGRATRLATRLYEESRAADDFSALSVEGLALELLAEAGRARARHSASPPRWLERAREMLHDRFADAPTLTEVATAVGVHPSHLAHEFRRHYRESAGEYARRLRVEEACRALAETDAPLSAVAARAGFYDQSHFTNAFRRVKGTTPARYRALLRPPQKRPK